MVACEFHIMRAYSSNCVIHNVLYYIHHTDFDMMYLADFQAKSFFFSPGELAKI